MHRPKVFVAAAMMMCCPLARGQTDFPAGATALSLAGSYSMPIRFSEEHIYGVHATIGKYIWNNHAASLELSGNYAHQPDGNHNVLIGAAGILARWHFLQRDRWSIFLDGGGGFAYAEHKFPTTRFPGTHFNLYGKVGLGASWKLRDREFLLGGVRYVHLSNGQIHGQDQNPGYDGLQYWIGVMWTR